MFINVLPHFLYSFILWMLFSKIPEMPSEPFDQPTYLLMIGMIKYVPVFLLAIVGGHIVTLYAKKGFVLVLIIIQVGLIFFLKQFTVDAYASLILLACFVLFSLIYEPLIDFLTAYYAEKKGEYVYMNTIVSLSRTSARLLAPMIFVYIIAKNDGDIFSTTQAVFLLLALAVLFVDFPKEEKKGNKKNQSLLLCMKHVLGNKSALGILMIYCVFYLGVNYLEYMVVISNKFESMHLGDLFMTMGAGFVSANLSLLILKNKLKSVYTMTLSLTLSGAMLMLLPWIEFKVLVFVALFLIGYGNGLAVPISMGFAQKMLKKELVPYFSGLLDTSINICAIISTGLGYVTMKAFGSRGVFFVDGLFLLGSVMVWMSLDKRDLEKA